MDTRCLDHSSYQDLVGAERITWEYWCVYRRCPFDETMSRRLGPRGSVM